MCAVCVACTRAHTKPGAAPHDWPPELSPDARVQRQRCEANDAKACLDFGVANQVGLYGERKLGAAAWGFARGCQLGSGRSCSLFAQLLVSGNPNVWHDEARARELARRACGLKDALGCELERDMGGEASPQ